MGRWYYKMMNLGKYKWWWILGLIIILLGGWVGYRWYNKDVVTIKVARVVRGEIEQVVAASGTVDAPVYELSPKLGGKIMAITVKEGELVRGGQTLAEFDDTTRLVAPAAGLVAKVNYDPGETVSPGQPAIVVVNYNKSWVNAQIDEIDIGSIKMGDKVKITSDVYPDKVFPGEIYWIAPLAELREVGGRVKMDEESYVFPCKIKFLGSSKELKVNMSVNVEILSKRKANTLVVPREALVSRDDSTYVFVLGKLNRRVWENKITLGIRSYSSVEALAGVKEGDEVAITEVQKLKNGGRVTVER